MSRVCGIHGRPTILQGSCTCDVGKPSSIRQYLTSPGWHASPHELCRLNRFSDGWFRYCGSAQRGILWCPEDANW